MERSDEDAGIARERALTQFQTESASAIKALMEARGRQVEYRTGGKHETYLFVELPELTLWIYEDELEMKAGGLHRLLERPDFESPEEMRAYFLSEIARAMDLRR